MISQLTVFLENEKGRLASTCRAIADAGINMQSLNVADTAEFGVVRALCDTPQKAAQVLREKGWRAAVTPVVAVRLGNSEGSLADLLEFLDSQNVNVEYGYCFSMNKQEAIDVFKIDAAEGFEDVLSQAGFDPVLPEEIYCLD